MACTGGRAESASLHPLGLAVGPALAEVKGSNLKTAQSNVEGRKGGNQHINMMQKGRSAGERVNGLAGVNGLASVKWLARDLLRPWPVILHGQHGCDSHIM